MIGINIKILIQKSKRMKKTLEIFEWTNKKYRILIFKKERRAKWELSERKLFRGENVFGQVSAFEIEND